MAGQVQFVWTRQTYTDASGKARTRWRKDPFHASGTSIMSAAVEGNAGPWLAHLANILPQQVHKALASGGYLMQKLLRSDIDAGGPAGTGWSPLSGVQVSGRLDMARRGAKRARRKARFFGALRQAIGYYRHQFPTMQVDVGWLSAAAQRYGYMLQRGTRTPVTRKSAGLFKGVFGWWPRKRAMDMPARPLMEPSLAVHAMQLAVHMENKVAQYLAAGERWMAQTRSNASQRAAEMPRLGGGRSTGAGAYA